MFHGRAARRAGVFLITVLLSTFVLFCLVRLAPGDPVKILLGNPEMADVYSDRYQERYDKVKRDLHLDEAIPAQYARWLKNCLELNLGNSIYSNRPVTSELLAKLPATIALTVPAIAIQLLLGLGLGVASALNANRWQDEAIRFFCAVVSSLPGFAMGLMLIYFFSVSLGAYEISTEASLKRLWLPALTLGVISSPGFIRLVRSSVLEEMGKLYVANDLALGKKRGVVVAGVLDNVSLQILAVTSTTFANLIGGSVVIESVFSWPGIGKYAMDSILMLDYPVIQGYGLFMVVLVIVTNTLVDMAQSWLDPSVARGGAPERDET